MNYCRDVTMAWQYQRRKKCIFQNNVKERNVGKKRTTEYFHKNEYMRAKHRNSFLYRASNPILL